MNLKVHSFLVLEFVGSWGLNKQGLNYFVQINVLENFAALVCFLIILS